MKLTRSQIRTKLQSRQGGTSDFDLNPAHRPKNADLKEAAVLIVICGEENDAKILLTKRSFQLSSHPGQIAFPGGKKDSNDKNLISTALREAEEEVGLKAENVEILGALSPHQTVTNFRVTPIVGWSENPWKMQLDTNEVAEAFFVPSDLIMNPAAYRVETKTNFKDARSFYVVPFGPYYIWGATARILKSFANQVHT